jgi:hypothetical protein
MRSRGRKLIISGIKAMRLLTVPRGGTSKRQCDTQVHDSPPQEESRSLFAEVPCATARSQCSYKKTGITCALTPPMCHALSCEEAKYLRNQSVAFRGCQTVGAEVAVQPMRP